MSETIDRACQLIDARLRQIRDERQSLERALVSLGGTGRAARNGSPLPRAGRRASRGQRKAEFVEILRESPGATSAEIAAAIGISPTQVSGIAGRLREAGEIRKIGIGYELTA